MPSEQAMGFPKLASDIYAVGAIGIECLTGKEPHQLFDEEMLEFKWRHLYLASDPKLDPLISELAIVLNKMLQQRITIAMLTQQKHWQRSIDYSCSSRHAREHRSF